MIATYHNHSRYSDGKATIAEMVDAAAAGGIDELGISDHLTLAPSEKSVSWSMPLVELEAYVEELQTIRQRAAISVRIGLEVDWFEEQRDEIDKALDGKRFDYLIGSVHFVGDFSVDHSAGRWSALSEDGRDRIHREYWTLIRQMAESGLFHIVGHLDLPKKFGFGPAIAPQPEIDLALDAITAAGMVVELNTAGWHKPCREAYPSLDLLQQCHRRGIAVTLSSDAHDPDHLVRDFDRGACVLTEAGYEQIARFSNGDVWSEPLDAFLAKI